MRIRHFLLSFSLFGLLIAGMLLCACSVSSPGSGTDAFWKKGFSAELSGEMSGVPFTALVRGGIRADGEPEGSVRYLSVGDGKNRGILLCRERDGTVSVTQNDHTARISGEEAEGLLAPLRCLLLSLETPSAVERIPDGNTVFFYPDGGSLTVSPDGTPVAAGTENVRFRVTRWENDQ